MPPRVLRAARLEGALLRDVLARYHLETVEVEETAPIPGSYWGDEEAGLIGARLYLRPDTPVHSILHEACHYICMDTMRRERLHTDAGGDDAEENAVCYLQILLADYLPPMHKQRMFQDMDTWGYSFRLGSARAWFENDAAEARSWLLRQTLIDAEDKPLWRLRST